MLRVNRSIICSPNAKCMPTVAVTTDQNCSSVLNCIPRLCQMISTHIHCVQKKEAHLISVITSVNVDRLSKFLHYATMMKAFISPELGYIITLPCQIRK